MKNTLKKKLFGKKVLYETKSSHKCNCVTQVID